MMFKYLSIALFSFLTISCGNSRNFNQQKYTKLKNKKIETSFEAENDQAKIDNEYLKDQPKTESNEISNNEEFGVIQKTEESSEIDIQFAIDKPQNLEQTHFNEEFFHPTDSSEVTSNENPKKEKRLKDAGKYFIGAMIAICAMAAIISITVVLVLGPLLATGPAVLLIIAGSICFIVALVFFTKILRKKRAHKKRNEGDKVPGLLVFFSWFFIIAASLFELILIAVPW